MAQGLQGQYKNPTGDTSSDSLRGDIWTLKLCKNK